MKKFNLSNKIGLCNCEYEDKTKTDAVLEVKDVKEFIKQLKVQVKSNIGYWAIQIYEDPKIMKKDLDRLRRWMIIEIDKLAGKDLI